MVKNRGSLKHGNNEKKKNGLLVRDKTFAVRRTCTIQHIIIISCLVHIIIKCECNIIYTTQV